MTSPLATPLDAGRHAKAGSARGRRLAATLAVATVLAQIAYPLTTGSTLRLLTIATVLLFAATSVIHAAATRGRRAATVLVVVAAGGGLLAEAVGVRTGLPFGPYAYADTLGPKVADVPLVVPMAWLMMAYPCLLLGRRLAARVAVPRAVGEGLRGDGLRFHAVAVTTGGLCMAAWDVFLDPQMVAAGHWSWAHPVPALPGVPGVPLTNYAGWALVAAVLMAVLHRFFPKDDGASEVVPAAMLAWTWIGSTVGNAVFFGRPLVALWGGALLGLFVLPYLLSWRETRA